MQKKFVLTFIFVFVLSSAFVLAQGPGVPHQFYGTATYNNAAAVSLSVETYIKGEKVASTTTANGIYGYNPIFLIKDPEGEYEGKTIQFYLNGVNTGQTYVFENGASTKLDLSASGTTTSPPPNGNGGSPGGGPGGGSSPSSTTSTQTTNDIVDLNIETQDDEIFNLDENQETTSPGITGAVIGFVKTGKGIGLIIGTIIILAGIGVIFMTRKSPKNE
jgi:hypothetical protein